MPCEINSQRQVREAQELSIAEKTFKDTLPSELMTLLAKACACGFTLTVEDCKSTYAPHSALSIQREPTFVLRYGDGSDPHSTVHLTLTMTPKDAYFLENAKWLVNKAHEQQEAQRTMSTSL